MIQFDGHSATVCSLAFSPDSMLLASGAKDGGVKVWDAAGVSVREHSLPGMERPVNTLAWNFMGEWIAGNSDSRLRNMPVGKGDEVLFDVGIRSEEMTSVAFLNEALLAYGSGSKNSVSAGSIGLWHMRAGKRPLPPSIAGSSGVRALSCHPPTKRLHWIAGLPNTSACVWRSWCITSPNATDVKLGKPASAITVSGDGSTVAIASDWLVRVFTENGKPLGELAGHKGQVTGVGFIHGGRTAVSASWDETVRFWDVATKKETARFPLGIGKLTALAVSPDGTRVAAGGTDGPIVLLDAE